jgi:hypothetical protein
MTVIDRTAAIQRIDQARIAGRFTPRNDAFTGVSPGRTAPHPTDRLKEAPQCKRSSRKSTNEPI